MYLQFPVSGMTGDRVVVGLGVGEDAPVCIGHITPTSSVWPQSLLFQLLNWQSLN